MCYEEMDEELKETVKSLAKSIKLTLKNAVTRRSDNSNSLTGSQHSDLIFGIHPAAAKRRKTMSEGDDYEPITDDEVEDEEDKTGKFETQ